MKSQEIGQKLAIKFNAVNGTVESAIDPATIITMAQLVLDLMQKIKECRQNKSQAVQTIKSPGLFHKIQLRRHLKEILGRDFRNNGDKIVQSVLETGKSLSNSDIEDLYDEVD